MPDASVGLGNAKLMVIGGVPYGAGLIGHGTVYLKLLGSVKGGAKGNYLREYGNVVVADSVAGLVPPVVGGYVKTVHRYGAVHHKAYLLLGSKQ